LLSVQVLATLGDPAPGPGNPGFLINDFEPGGLTNNGTVIYGADLGTTSDPSSFVGEAIYLRNNQGMTIRLAGSTDPAPGTSTVFDSQGFYGPVTLNDQGDAALSFQLFPLQFPFGVNGGLFRYSHNTNAVTPVVVPFVTPAPGTGGDFQGTIFGNTLTNLGDLFFDGIISTPNGIHVPSETYDGLGEGIFKQDASGHISSVLVPGAAAPGGSTFDWVSGPFVNNGGDMAFEGHVVGGRLFDSSNPLYVPQAIFIGFEPNNVYFRDGGTGQITLIASDGETGPDGSHFYSAYGAQMNSTGDIIFIANLTADETVDGLYRYSMGTTIAIAVPGEAMPGGGHLATVSGIFGSQQHINNQGDILFNATLDTSTNGVPDQGMYLWSKGQLTLVARTGTVLPGIGTIAELSAPRNIIVGPSPGDFPTGGAYLNDRGQVLFSATLTDGRDVLLLETLSGGGKAAAAVTPAHGAPAAVSPWAGGGKGASTGASLAAAAGVDLSEVAAVLLLGDPHAARLAEVPSTSGPTNASSPTANGSAVALLPQERPSPAPALSAAVHGFHRQAVDDLFATFGEGIGENPLE
jgi:hypothetical protein